MAGRAGMPTAVEVGVQQKNTKKDKKKKNKERFLTFVGNFHPKKPWRRVRMWIILARHILDTLKYAEDCDRMFRLASCTLSLLGMRGAEDPAICEGRQRTPRRRIDRNSGVRKIMTRPGLGTL